MRPRDIAGEIDHLSNSEVSDLARELSLLGHGTLETLFDALVDHMPVRDAPGYGDD